jgi:transcriptional regulator, RpiR family
MGTLSEAERLCAQYILKNPQLIPNMTTKDLSKNSGVSESTVVRFCKSIGISSYKAFKLELVKELALQDYNITDVSVLEKKEEPYKLFQKVIFVNKSAIEAITASIDRKELEKAVMAISNARRLIFYGVGGSATAAYDGYYKFFRLGYECIFQQDFHFMLSMIPYVQEKDIFIAISMSGKTMDVLELARFAKRKGATIIAITNLDKSPLYKEADIRLCTPVVEHDYRIGSLPSRITQLTIIDALYLNTFLLKGDSILHQYQEARREALRLRR